VAEAGKEASYRLLDRDRYGFPPWAFGVCGGVAPTADEFFQRLASVAVSRRTTLAYGRRAVSMRDNSAHQRR
jgi:hypothetical protein